MLKVLSPYSPVLLVTVVLTTLRHPFLSSNDDCALLWLGEKDNKSAMMTAPVLLACLFDMLMVMIAITLVANYRWVDSIQNATLFANLSKRSQVRVLNPNFLFVKYLFYVDLL